MAAPSDLSVRAMARANDDMLTELYALRREFNKLIVGLRAVAATAGSTVTGTVISNLVTDSAATGAGPAKITTVLG